MDDAVERLCQHIGMTVDDIWLAFAVLNGAQTIEDVAPRTLLYWSGFFIELTRRINIIRDGGRQLLDNPNC